MKSPVLTIVLPVGLSGSFLTLVPKLSTTHIPGNQQDDEPVQPIAFSRLMHASETQIACLYCHSGAETSRHAGILVAST